MRSRSLFSLREKQERLLELEQRSHDKDFWSRPDSARTLIAEQKSIRSITEPYLALEATLQEDIEILEMAQEPADASMIEEIRLKVGMHQAEVQRMETIAFFRHPDDRRNAVLSIRSGAGGTDAMDWAEHLERMYLRWLENAGFDAKIVDRLEGSEAGIHYSEIEVRGPFAYGHLRSEIGVHRVCHISDFDANGKKQTSFAAVDAVPIHPEVTVDLKDEDLEMETFCSGGPGGQNTNKVASAVRIRHLPTGLMVKCQSQRSQLQNRDQALEILASKVLRFEQEKREVKGIRTEAAFGHQIRTYVLHPYTLVKDHRTEHQTGNAKAVLDGDLGGFVEAFLRRQG